MKFFWPVLLMVCIAAVAVQIVHAAPSNRVSDVINTRHNLSAVAVPNLPNGAARDVLAQNEQQICVFCHTPHAAEPAAVPSPLWNRKLSSATYSVYGSASIDATDINQPDGTSKLCLSCHDGTLAIGAVNVLNGNFTDQDASTEDIAMTGTGTGGVMAPGAGVSTGFTRNLGIDLTNDHPISFTYDTALASTDGELRDPTTASHIGNRVRGVAPPLVPLEGDKVQCNSCHDPHIRSTDAQENIKFLRLNRLQQLPPLGSTFDQVNDIICLACHDKAGWVGSAHANDLVADETYIAAAANLRDFPIGTPVWRAACLNCHDTHTVQGSRRLLREGVSGAGTPKPGGDPAIEETCWTCHSSDGGTLTAQGFSSQVPDIKTDFTLPGNRRMPIATMNQANGFNAPNEVHNIGTMVVAGAGKDLLESPEQLGKGDLNKRHVECTDCHNPHRVIKGRLFYGNTASPDPAGTHHHNEADIIASSPGGIHTNIASGVLRGSWGVEPLYSGTSFYSPISSFTVKRGDPGISADSSKTAPHVTREYQICLKCHSNYAYDTPPVLGSFIGGTPVNTNSMTSYTNQAQEFQAPLSHQGEGTKPGSGAFSGTAPISGVNVNFEINNHRGWHPVLEATGRTPAVRNADPNAWRSPFQLGVGVQTMFCSDCHGSATTGYTAEPDGGENGNPWGPHGSSNNFILKGRWDNQTGSFPGGGQTDGLCFKCHNYDDYANPSNMAPRDSGFSGTVNMGSMCMTVTNNFHAGHARCIINQNGGSFRCSFCHVAVPHGWKNKALLVNLNDVGPEGGFAGGGNQVRNNTTARYYNGPYYNGAVLKVLTFRMSGQWQAGNCGSAGPPGQPGNAAAGRSWMAMGSEACNNLP